MAQHRVGIWLVGARGGVATTVTLGLAALRRGLVDQAGLVTELPLFAELGLVAWDQLVIAGHEIRSTRLLDEARKLADVSRAVDRQLIEQCREELEQVDERIRAGVLQRCGSAIESLADPPLRQRRESPRDAIARVQQDLKQFIADEQLDQVVVVNVASTEPPLDCQQIPDAWSTLERLLDDPSCPLAASSLYAIAALDLGLPYINFTPSTGSSPAAIRQLAVLRGTCHMGRDGKTGETLLKSVLAPMFATRNLKVASWVGYNIFGNMDACVLNDPANKQAKVASKDHVLSQILGYRPQTKVGIELVESLGDWKTAWDHIHFRGFLGTPMVMQFIWQGCDSLLAAPLVLDLARLAERAHRHGHRGLLTFLASFFKSPMGVEQHDYLRQFQMLETWVDQLQDKSC